MPVQKTILIIEDDTEINRMLCILLARNAITPSARTPELRAC